MLAIADHDPGRQLVSVAASPTGVERVAYRPLRNAPDLVLLISAIGASFFLQYTVRGFFGSGPLRLPGVGLPGAAGAHPARSTCAGWTSWSSSPRCA